MVAKPILQPTAGFEKPFGSVVQGINSRHGWPFPVVNERPIYRKA
jgi:hypothetical protein